MVNTKIDIVFAVITVNMFMFTASPTTLDRCKMHHEVFEKHVGLQIMFQKQGYCLAKIL